jgi:hypothetical protein
LSFTFFTPPFDKLSAVYPSSITGNRVVKGEFSFTMPQANDVLTISNTNFISVQGTASAEPPSEVGCECAPMPIKSLGWLCRVLAWGCPVCGTEDDPTPNQFLKIEK